MCCLGGPALAAEAPAAEAPAAEVLALPTAVRTLRPLSVRIARKPKTPPA